ncbi:uncharacterized protein B0J16DRAFT_347517, partial [Fusarium flagelliforme]|uniref:uncharacterized protein n=1 Tax=Fusarium flagelliforme TaxID=2675880 RepID=UPI001E8E480B
CNKYAIAFLICLFSCKSPCHVNTISFKLDKQKKEMLGLQTLRVMGHRQGSLFAYPSNRVCSCMYVSDTHHDSFTSFQRVQLLLVS